MAPAPRAQGSMSQSKLESCIESTLNVASGFSISWLEGVFVIPPLSAALP